MAAIQQPLVPYGSNNNGESISNNNQCVASFPPGYRFSPTDVELVVIYLKKKVMKEPLPFSNIMKNVIREANLYEFDPERLVEIHGKTDEKEWYFFTPRERKYTNGKRSSRAAGIGTWKGTTGNKEIKSNGTIVGYKRTLVFYKEEVKTDWIMHEFICAGYNRERTSLEDMRLDDCVLCHIYDRSNKPNQSQGEKNGRRGNSPVRYEAESRKEISNGVCPQIYCSVSSSSHQPPNVQSMMGANYGNQNLISQVPMQTSFGTVSFPPVSGVDPIIVDYCRFNYLKEGSNGYQNSMSQVPMQSSFATGTPFAAAVPPPLLHHCASSASHQPTDFIDYTNIYPANTISDFIYESEDSQDYTDVLRRELQRFVQPQGP